jgi:hypothetical protein
MRQAARLGREYLDKKEIKDAPLNMRRHITNRGDFFFDGHRLSSLYRMVRVDRTGLTKRNEPASFLQKYSNPTSAEGVASRGKT